MPNKTNDKRFAGRIKPGEVRNPTGRPKKPEVEELRKALAKAAKLNDKTFLEHVAQRAYTDANIAIALLRKLLPDLRSVDQDIRQEIEQVATTEADEVKALKAKLARLTALEDAESPIVQRIKRTG